MRQKGEKRGEERIEIQRILQSGAADAAELLVETMRNPDAKPGERYSAALEILNRLYGKTVVGDGEEGEIEIHFSGEAKRYAK